MKKDNMVIGVISLILVSVSLVMAEPAYPDFDGGAGRTVAFTEALAADAIAVPLPEESAKQMAGANQGVPAKVFGENGAKLDIKIKYLVGVKAGEQGREGLWAVGVDNKAYALGVARSLPEFAAPKKLADILSPFERASGAADRYFSCSNGCKTEAAYRCENGRAMECTVTMCGRCWKNQDRECECEWDTYSAPHSCRDSGNPC